MGVNISKMNYSFLVEPKKCDPQTFDDLTTELYPTRGAYVRVINQKWGLRVQENSICAFSQ